MLSSPQEGVRSPCLTPPSRPRRANWWGCMFGWLLYGIFLPCPLRTTSCILALCSFRSCLLRVPFGATQDVPDSIQRNRFIPDVNLDAGRGVDLPQHDHSGWSAAPWYDEGDEDRTSSKKFGMSLLTGKRATELRSLPDDAPHLLTMATGSQ